MRQRSMSVYQPRDDNRLSKKFEGVVSDVEGQSDSEEEEEDITEAKDEGTVEAWTKADYDLLIEKLRGVLPKKDTKKAKSTLQHINWEEIQIRQHSSEEVRRVALSLVAKVRTYRTLGELLNDVPEVVDKVLSADKPKAPLTAYSVFMREYIPQCSNVKDAFRTGSKTFQELSAKKKKKYEDAAAQLKAEYQEKLAKYYEDHPDMVPVPKAKKSSRSAGRPKGAGSTSKAQLKRGRNRTPFNLFYESRLEEVPVITLQQCRQEWEELAVKDKLPFIRKSFESAEDTKLLNKKEQELFAISCGKPAFIGRTAYDYFQRQNRSKYDDLAPKERKQKLDNEYKQMSERQKLDLKVAFLAAKDNYVLAYQNYIKELPEAKQKVEIEYLKSISSGSAGKKDKTLPTKKTKEDDHYPGSTDEDPPVAESTTIKKKQNPTKKKPAAAAVPPPVEESEDEDEEPVTRPPMPSPTKRSRMEPPPRGSPSKAVPEPKAKTKAKKQLEQRFEASSGDDSSASQRNGRKRHKEVEAQVEEEEQQQREEVAEVADSGKKSKKKAKKDEEKPKVPMREPERPPTVLEEFYRQRVYKGKVGKHKESFASLSAARKRDIKEQMALAQKAYIEEFELFLKSMPKDQIRVYIQKVNKMKAAAAAREAEEEEEEGSTETGSSGSSDEEDDDE
uniref:Nucleolar transcription factor 1 n=1 Tax=Culex pipiens TaxID=7175 RepID=A0A8D8AE75_CULPI